MSCAMMTASVEASELPWPKSLSPQNCVWAQPWLQRWCPCGETQHSLPWAWDRDLPALCPYVPQRDPSLGSPFSSAVGGNVNPSGAETDGTKQVSFLPELAVKPEGLRFLGSAVGTSLSH